MKFLPKKYMILITDYLTQNNMIFLLKKLNFVYIFYNKMEYEKIHSTTTDIINKLDENGNIVTTKLKKVYKYGILQEKYYLNNKNKLHRDEDKPAQIEYFNKNKYIYIHGIKMVKNIEMVICLLILDAL
jgi:hypothetical protein